MATFKTVADRLYKSIFWLTLAVAVCVFIGTTVVQVHDHVIVGADFECFDDGLAQANAVRLDRLSKKPRRESPKPSSGVVWDNAGSEDFDWDSAEIIWDPAIGARCNIEQITYGRVSNLYAMRAWESPVRDAPRLRWAALSLLAFIPVGLLAGLNRWLRWLLK